MNASASSTAVLLAGGKGARMDGTVADKILAPLGGSCAFTLCLRAFRDSGVTSRYVITCRDEVQKASIESLVQQEMPDPSVVVWVPGGPRRQDSVWNALCALDAHCTHVFIHDCARPLIQPALLARLLEIVCADGAACPARRVTDTIKQVPGGHPELRHMHLRDIPREFLWVMETPQVFDRNLILDAYRRILRTDEAITDDAAAVEQFGHTVSLIENKTPNFKLTAPHDFDLIETLLEKRAQEHLRHSQ